MGLFSHLIFRPLRSSPTDEQVNRDVPLTRKERKYVCAGSDRHKILRNINIYALSARHYYCGPHSSSIKKSILNCHDRLFWEGQCEWHSMTSMTGPDCAVMFNLINIHTHHATTLPSCCLCSLRIFPSLPGYRLHFLYCDASSALFLTHRRPMTELIETKYRKNHPIKI